MPDITMCKDNSCPMRWKCYRFMVAPSEYRQSYFEKSPRDESKCEYFESEYFERETNKEEK